LLGGNVLHELYNHNYAWRINVEQSPFDRERRSAEASGPHIQRFQFGPWLFNVNRAKDIIVKRPRETLPIPVQPWAHFYGLDTPEGNSFSLFRPSSHFDAEYALTTDLDEPTILATLRGGRGERFPLLIDGTHRLYHAHVEGITELPAYVLTVQESLRIREDAYHR
jgi:hypothetical protein